MMYVVQVEQNSLRARSDPMPAATALKVAKAWQSHGDRGVRLMEAVADGSEPQSWTIRDFIAFIKQGGGGHKPRGVRIADPVDTLLPCDGA